MSDFSYPTDYYPRRGRKQPAPAHYEIRLIREDGAVVWVQHIPTPPSGLTAKVQWEGHNDPMIVDGRSISLIAIDLTEESKPL
jgi:hypothetical protein